MLLMTMTEQLDFLDLVPIGKDIIEVHVHDDGSGLYWATIGDWWYATGATKQATIKAVVDRYQHEMPTA